MSDSQRERQEREKLEHGREASSREYFRYDQVGKRDYRLAEQPGDAEPFDEEFRIRVLDLGRWLHGDGPARSAFAAELGAAMRAIGFVVLEGHGVDQRLFERAAEDVGAFFRGVPAAEKLPFRAARHGAVSEGWFPVHETSAIHPDLVEGWVFGRRAFDLDGDTGFDARRFWPRPALEPRFRALVEAELPLFRPILQAILTGLGVDPHLYDARMERPQLGLRLNWYPPLPPDAPANAGRLLGHEDIDLFTLLPAPTVEGLQVLHRSGKWVRLDAPPGSIVLNTGDYLQRLSNDLLPSTTHRVSPPRDPALRARERVSFPLAAYLPPDDVLRVLPGLGPPRYEPIKVITFHTRTTAKFYGDGYAVEEPVEE